MKVLGIDPDTGTTAWALVSTDTLHACGLVISNRGIWGHARVADQHRALIREICTAGTPLRQAIEAADKIVVEGQHFKNKKVNPDNIVKVAHITGGIEALCRWIRPEDVETLDPTIWTDGFAKEARMARIPRLLNTTYEAIAEMAGCSLTDANHIVDAAGQGRYYAKNSGKTSFQFRQGTKRRRRRR